LISLLVSALMSETAGDKSWKTVAFDNSNQIEVEVSAVLRGCFTIQGEGSMQLDLLLQDADAAWGSGGHPFWSSITSCIKAAASSVETRA